MPPSALYAAVIVIWRNGLVMVMPCPAAMPHQMKSRAKSCGRIWTELPLAKARPLRHRAALQPLAGLFRKAARRVNASVAQLVEHATENRSVGGSNPPRGTTSFPAPNMVHRPFANSRLCSYGASFAPAAAFHVRFATSGARYFSSRMTQHVASPPDLRRQGQNPL